MTLCSTTHQPTGIRRGLCSAHRTGKGRIVAAINRSTHTGLDSEGLLSLLANDDHLAEEVARAGAITISIGHNDGHGTSPTIRATATTMASSHPGYLHARMHRRVVAGLWRAMGAHTLGDRAFRVGVPALLPVTNVYDSWLRWPALPDPLAPDINVVRQLLEAQDRLICRIAERHNALCADLHTAFNGQRGFDAVAEWISGPRDQRRRRLRLHGRGGRDLTGREPSGSSCCRSTRPNHTLLERVRPPCPTGAVRGHRVPSSAHTYRYRAYTVLTLPRRLLSAMRLLFHRLQRFLALALVVAALAESAGRRRRATGVPSIQTTDAPSQMS